MKSASNPVHVAARADDLRAEGPSRRTFIHLAGAGAVGLLLPRLSFGLEVAEPEYGAASLWRLWNVADRSCFRVPEPAGVAREIEEVVRAQRSAGDGDRANAEGWAKGVTVWTQVLLQKIQSQRTDPLKAARGLALLHTAALDATILVAAGQLAFRREPPSVQSRLVRVRDTFRVGPTSYPSTAAAVAGAASTVLAYLYPGLTAEFPGGRRTFHEAAGDALQAQLVLGLAFPSDLEIGFQLGERVGIAAVERARVDGSLAQWTPSGDPTLPQSPVPELQLPERENVRPTGPAYWVPTPPAYHFPPAHPLAGNWKPWVVATGSQVLAPPPPSLDAPFPSKRFLAEAQEVHDVVKGLTDEQRGIAKFWADNPGSSPTPPGHWIRELVAELARLEVPPARATRVLAYVSAGLADAGICCWATKYKYWTVRPVTAIRTLEGQPFHDPTFESVVLTPPFPSYTSGHSTFSGCAAGVMEALLPEARVGTAGGARVAPSAAAEEAAVSRLYGGIHYRSDNQEGLVCGRKVAELVVARARREDEAAHGESAAEG